VIVHAGGVNVFADRSGWSTVSLEEFLLANPDIIIVSSGGGMDSSKNDLIRKEFMTRPQYASLSAVKNSHVYVVNADIISRAGPRIADAAEDIARITHAVEEERAASRAVAIPTGATKTPGFTAIIAALGLLAIVARGRK
jgi:iron complex transport system substrate-binding protein